MKKKCTRAIAFDKQLLRKLFIMTKICFILLTCTVFSTHAENSYAQLVKLNLDLKNVPLYEVISAIKSQTEFEFAYDSELETLILKNVSIQAKGENINNVMAAILRETDINYKVIDKIVLLSKGTVVSTKGPGNLSLSQQQTVSGLITDFTSGEPLPGVNIVVEGTTLGTVSDMDGKYVLNMPTKDAVLVFSFVGYNTERVMSENRSVIDVKMVPDITKLEEIVVVGYSTQKKVTLTGAVSSVKSEDIIRTKNENVMNMLTGKLPGVRIVQKSSAPGSYDAAIDIRGMGDPLYVVDGVPRDKEYFSRMSGEEIESVSVLKDGTAAIYGLRAANGVILVTTKSGTKNGKVDIIFNSSYSIQQFLYVPEGVSAQDYMLLRNEQNWQDFNGNYLVRRTPIFTQDVIQPYLDGKPSYNWMDAVFHKNTPQQEHNLSVNGGNEKLTYYFTLGYAKQNGAYKSNDYFSDRWNLRTNIDAFITKRLKARVSLGGIMTMTEQPNGTGWSTYKNTWLMRPDAPIYANDNPAYFNGDQKVQYDGHNMVLETNSDYVGYNRDKNRRFNGTLQLSYDIPGIKGLMAKGSYDYALRLPDFTSYKRAYTLYQYNPDNDTYTGSLKNSPSSIQRRTEINYDTDMQLGLHYNNKFGNHSFNSFIIYEETYNTWDGFSAYRELLIDSEYLFAGEDKNQLAIGNGIGDRASKSLLGQFGYDYNSKYIFDFKFRYDGSSRFPDGSRFGFFPVFSAGWRLSEENFIKNNIAFIDNLKIRGSYGEMGDDSPAGDYPPTPGFGLNSNALGWYFGGTLNGGVSPSGIPNPNLTWLRIKSYNLALDFSILKNKLSGSFEVYQRDRSGLLATSSSVIPGTVGASLPQENLNSDRNFGYEISLEHRNSFGDFSYNVGTQISATKSMRTEWLETPASNSYDKWRNRTSGRYNNIWWGTESGGMFTTYDQIRNSNIPQGQGAVPGDWWIEDWNEDGVIDANDDHPIANLGLPVFNYGISLGASWKNIDLAMDFQGAYGVYVQYAEVLTEALAFGGQNTLTWFMDRWHPKDPNADIFNPNTEWVSGYYPITGHDGRRTGNNNVQNASYMRLKTMELGYTLPKNILAKVGIQNLRVYVSGYNLLTFTGLRNVDPERPGSQGGASTDYIQFYNYPVNRIYTLGASVKF